MESLKAIQEWYAACCDGDWEHTYGVHIQTLDNPGWSLDVDIIDTPLENQKFEPVKLERSKNDWFYCQVIDGKFKGAGGPRNLGEILRIFRDWTRAICNLQ
ncbi:MAG: immunity 53 family protein [Planctomycetes bacterium]|nr:immunity 53 family protein [Planctomycetota bacterium]